MSEVRLVDVSLRDGNQSIWGAVGVTTRMVEGVAADLDRVGYRAVELASSTLLATAVRYHREDPWERLRAARDRMPNTPLGFLTTGKRFITFYRTPDALFELAFGLLVRNGISRLWVIDPMHDMAGARRTAELAKRAGFTDVVGGICYTTSPVHTDEYFADKIAELDDCPAIDSIYLKDPAGLLTPERVRTLVPMLQSRLKRLRLNEIHSHSTTGVSPLTVLDAADLGIDTIHCALPPLANGSSHPSAPRLVQNLRARGHQVAVEEDAMQRASAYLQRQARIKRLPVGSPNEYDEGYYRHTIPGGVQSTLARQLGEIGRPELFPAVIEESVQVREDLGWPIVMTPFAQYIVTQATLNVISGERYRQLSDEVIDLLRGDFGPLPGPVDQDLLDRAMATRRGQQPVNDGSEQVTIDDLRGRFGRDLSDEDLLMRAVMPAEQVDAMVAARGRSTVKTLKSLLTTVQERPNVTSFSISAGDTSFSLQRGKGTTC
ncbi:pyruvate/oxaloacetate carboxyltransferase [Micromonospora globispora]|uniref:pyruvate/oxaloacetate carboxyltransferase n=1 Tax=Micromonospora globispora TaxID=1450148 RepID=UPI000D703E14|nr:pyruvate/oxaloacetate carboxyltransferase [Micromonospora globispora]PWU55445.1 pyruvate/oxaloacetate carboxyltransferase [Micromonospora globispora]RQW91844.1 pyruvate/oxaloacetate carboxyltransferase [Micromonospora globispora]